MPRVKKDKAREQRIEMEAVVDAYNSEERAMGWYYYLEGRLKVPLKPAANPSARFHCCEYGKR